MLRIWLPTCSHSKRKNRKNIHKCDDKSKTYLRKYSGGRVAGGGSRYHRLKAEVVKAERSEFLCFDIDGIAQRSYTLLHWIMKTKIVRGNGLGMSIADVLMHVSVSGLRVYTMTENQSTRSNHVVKWFISSSMMFMSEGSPEYFVLVIK